MPGMGDGKVARNGVGICVQADRKWVEQRQGSDDGLVVVSDGVQKLWGCGAAGGESGFSTSVIRTPTPIVL